MIITLEDSVKEYNATRTECQLRQFGFLETCVRIAKVKKCALDEALVRGLHYHATVNLVEHAGNYRDYEIKISHSNHEPPGAKEVPALMKKFYKKLSALWNKKEAFEIAAYVLWRINWIHPFENGNGRTARAACYYAICAKLGGWLPGTNPIPVLITKSRKRYYRLLDSADKEFEKTGNESLGALEEYLEQLLKKQLQS